MRIFFLSTAVSLTLFCSPTPIQAQTKPLAPTKRMAKKIKRHNARVSNFRDSTPEFEVSRSYAEYETAGYLVMSSKMAFDSKNAKLAMAKNLPEGVNLVIYHSGNEAAQIAQTYAPYLSSERLEIVQLRGSNGFWSRDGLPVPVFLNSNEKPVGAVDARYHHGFEPDLQMSQFFRFDLLKHDYYFEGGNFLPDSRGNCVVINNSGTASIPDTTFLSHYGCQNMLRLEKLSGIGHIDERVKFISDTIAITDTSEYVERLESLGYEVHLVAKPAGRWETYVNSLLINGTLYMPSYGRESDETAAQVYRDLGLKVVLAESSTLSNSGLGSIHCITMTYPKMSRERMLDALDAF